MSTRPRMSAPIGRLQIRKTTGKGAASFAAGVQAAEPASDEEVGEEEARAHDDTVPRFYPFAPRLLADGDD